MENGVMQEVSRKRNLDKRRETSRFAARDRRGKEADIFVDLREVVPIVEENTVTHVDRIALLRVAATMCRMRNHIGKALQSPLRSDVVQNELWSEDTISECLDGFIMMIDMDGLILYISESVSIYLGITQTDLIGRYLREFINQKDYEAYMKLVQTNKAKGNMNGNACDGSDANLFTRTIVLRMKSVISPRGRNLNLKSAIYKPVWVCYRTVCYAGNNYTNMMHCSTNPAGTGANITNAMSGVASKSGEYSTGTGMTRHTCDMKISFISENMNKIVRSNQRSLIGSSFYELVHPGDVSRVFEWIRDLLVKSHCRTSFYRILGASKNVIWVQTDAVTVNHTIRGKKEQYIICTHNFLGTQTDNTSAQNVELNAGCETMSLNKIIKKEIIDADSPEYGGLQPMFVECVDFTPLVSSEASLLPANLDEYAPIGVPDSEFGRTSGSTSQQQFQPQGQIARKSSYDDVLQWLFRDHPDSPAPFSSRYDQTLRSNQDERASFVGENPPIRSNFSIQLHDPASRRQSPELSGRSGKDSSAALYRHQRTNNSDRSTSTSAMGDQFCGSYRSSPLSSNGSNRGQNEGASPMEWSPLATGISECNVRSPVRSTVDGVSCISRPFRDNSAPSGVPFMPINSSGMRATNGVVPTISQPDGYNLMPGTNAYRTIGARSIPGSNVYSNVSVTHSADSNARARCPSTAETSSACTGMRRPFGQFEPQQFVPLRVGQSCEPSSHNTPNNNINFTKSTNDGSMHKSPLEYSQLYVDCQDNLRSLAPFVAHEDEFQLTTNFPADLQGLFNDDPTDDWMNSFGPLNTGSMNGPSMCGADGLDNCNSFVNDQLF